MVLPLLHPFALLIPSSVLQYGLRGRQVLQRDSQRFEDGDVVGGAVPGVGRVDLPPDDVTDLADQNLPLEGRLVDLAALQLWSGEGGRDSVKHPYLQIWPVMPLYAPFCYCR